jgi:tRNA (cmo5U34)-methyltransferase
MKAGDKISSKNANWSFRGRVFKNFDKHIGRSVPLYNECQNLYLILSDYFLLENAKIIDIGCSTGVFLKKLFHRHFNNNKKIEFVGYDTVKEMISYCKKNFNKKNIKFLKKSALKADLSNSCIISSFYTMQFIPTDQRQILVNKIFKNLKWGGAFFMVEKVRASDARFQDILNQHYIDYKIQNGYSSEEIISKSRSLKSVLVPFSTKGNVDMLKRAGFLDIITVFKYGSFEGFLAIK